MATAGPRILYWSRTDLRLHDSPALSATLSQNPSVLYFVWCWDPHYVYRARVGPNRWQFLLDCQNDFSQSLTKLNPKQKLLVVREAPQSVLPNLCKEWKIDKCVWEKDTDGYARERDREVQKELEKLGVEVVVRTGRTLYDCDELVKANGGRPTMSISQVQNAAKKLPPIPRPLPSPTSLPDPGSTSLSFVQSPPSALPDFNASHRISPDSSYTSLLGPNNDFSPPTLAELGIAPATTSHRGGETVALAALDAIIANERYTATFEKPNTAPTAFSPQSTTLLSPHHHFGSLSCRMLYWRAQDVVDAYEKAGKGKGSRPPTSLTGQMLFRDMYFGAQAALGTKFAQTFGNETTRFIPWHLPSRIDGESGLITGGFDVDDVKAKEYFLRWKWGRTGFPWIDALMRQLRLEGWIHHLGRHAVACFLTRGGCYVDWERGAEVFEEWLIDHETACNAGNWQWLSCVAFYSQFYRCYSPIAFPTKWDKHGAFVRRYVPELSNFSDKYIYEPWKAPISDQKKWGCVIRGDGGYADAEEGRTEALVGLDVARGEGCLDGEGKKVYPKPMFEFGRQRDVCIQGVKNAYEVGLHGNHAKVLDGTWRELFSNDAEGPTEGESGLPGAMIAEEGEGVGHAGDDLLGRHDDGESGTSKVNEASPVSPRASTSKKHKREDSHDEEAEVKSPKVLKTSPRKGSKSGGQATLDGMFTSPKAAGKRKKH